MIKATENFLKHHYHYLRPLIPRWLQIKLRRWFALKERPKYSNIWPIDKKTANPPMGWPGWPGGKQFALILTHDVDTAIGQERCTEVAMLEEGFGFRSLINFVAEDYYVSAVIRGLLVERGFEIGVHGLYHRKHPFRSRKAFQKQAVKINQYLKAWGSVGFRSPCMYHNLDWIGELDIEYDCSTFDTDPFEPQPEGVGTIFPFLVQSGYTRKNFVELPYTMPQDFTLFVLMKEKNIDIWKKKLDWIVDNRGMALVTSHPNYMNFEKRKCGIEEYPMELYEEFLDYVKSRYEGQYWNPLPREMARFWKEKIVIDQSRCNRLHRTRDP